MAHTYQTTLIKQIEIANGTGAFIFERPNEFTYRAGQSIDLSLILDGKPNMSHTFSLVSAPHEEQIEIATRLRDSEYKHTLRALEIGDEVSIEGPYGSFTLHENSERPAVFLVGGIGITPFLSMIRDVQNRSLPHQLYLFYSNRTSEDAAYLAELQAAETEIENLTLIPTMTNLSADAKWDGERGYIDWDMITRHAPYDANPVYYSAGPQKMVSAMHSLLTDHGVSGDDIRFEEFPGY